jgi:hypothetical protein
MEPAKVFEDILTPGERLLWSGKMVTIPLGLGIWCPILLLSGLVVSFVMPLLFGTMRGPVPTEGIVAMGACAALAVAACAWAVRTNRADAETVYAVTDRRLLCAVGEQRSGIREVALSRLEGAFVSPAQHGPVINHGQLVEFTLLKEHQSLLLPGMWRFAESGKPDAWRARSWRVENPRLVAGLAGRAIVSSQTDGLLTRAVQ